MKEHRVYREYPALGVENLGMAEGNFNNMLMHCGMAYDKKQDVTSLCTHDNCYSLFVWSEGAIRELRNKSVELKKLQLDVVAYLWEICYDPILAKAENISMSSGLESLRLSVNDNRKRNRDGE